MYAQPMNYTVLFDFLLCTHIYIRVLQVDYLNKYNEVELKNRCLNNYLQNQNNSVESMILCGIRERKRTYYH